MIAQTEAANELKRLSGLDYFPKEADALRELRQAAETADSVQILHCVITDWIAEQREAPKPTDLRRIIFERNAPKATGCEQCSGFGWVEVVNPKSIYPNKKACVCRSAA